MRWQDLGQSGNARFGGGGGGGGRGLALGGGGLGLVAVAVIAMLFGVDPRVVMQGGAALQQTAPQQAGTAADTDEERFVSAVLASTEQVWGQVFQQNGSSYTPPQLRGFEGAIRTGCGQGVAAMGPFYCPLDRTVYLDLSFFKELSTRFGAGGDFAQAYVIGHEVGHHIQTLTGTSEDVRRQQARVSKTEGNQLSVRLELQADCYAGVWAARANQANIAQNGRPLLEPGDVEEGLAAANAIGDDTLQRQSQGRVVPDAFTHGSSEQRVRWFRRGLEAGNPDVCDTFSARSV
jgi:predicted metalloprotease